jgi:hypothetical protein
MGNLREIRLAQFVLALSREIGVQVDDVTIRVTETD